jgi:2-polyprenyl-3-methyl-5-hydroxy-6-metoxy-1,4-benzoquinol methylase
MISHLNIYNTKRSGQTREESYTIRDRATNEYLQNLREQSGRPLSIIDIGGGCQIRSPDTTHVVDLLPLSYFGNDFNGEFFQGDIDLSYVWNRLFDYVAKNGKFDFAVCSHTLEDINAPHQVVLNLFKIANAGMVAVPSKYIETCKWENMNGPYLGYHHHRWIYTVKNGIFYGYPKMGTLENCFGPKNDFVSRKKYRQLFGHEGFETQTEMVFLWEDSFPVRFISPFMYHYLELTENKRPAFINLIEPDDVCALINSETIMKVITDYPVAKDSPDHIFPWGTKRDNTTDLGFIQEIEQYFNRKIKTLDVGCSGGQLTIDFNNRGHTAIGIEGSDYSVKHHRANWPQYHNRCLFTCDATKPYQVVDDEGNPVQFDLITSWEVVEHIRPGDLRQFFTNIKNHMADDAIFCASIAPIPDIIEGHVLHQSVFTKEVWFNKLLPKHFSQVSDLPFQNKVRYGDSFHVMLKE